MVAGPRDHDAPAHPRREVDVFAPRPPEGLGAIVAALRVARDETNIRHTGRIHEIPTRASIARMLEGARTVLFPSHFGGTELDEETLDFFVGSTLHGVLARLHEDARRSLSFASDPKSVGEPEIARRAQRFVDDVAGSLPTLRRLAVGDLEAVRSVDATGAGLSELLVCDPGVRALLAHRFAHVLHAAGIPLLARLASEVAREETGIAISPTARLGPRIAILGPVSIGPGVVIAEGTVLGPGAR